MDLREASLKLIYTVENTSDLGQPARVFDANGLEWTRCLECDTETGRILRLKTIKDEETGVERLFIDDLGLAQREEIYAAAPLLVTLKGR